MNVVENGDARHSAMDHSPTGDPYASDYTTTSTSSSASPTSSTEGSGTEASSSSQERRCALVSAVGSHQITDARQEGQVAAAAGAAAHKATDGGDDDGAHAETESVALLRRRRRRQLLRSGNRYQTRNASRGRASEGPVTVNHGDEYRGAGDVGAVAAAVAGMPVDGVLGQNGMLRPNRNVVVRVDFPSHARIAVCLGVINTMIVFYILLLEVYKTVLLL